MKRRLSHVLACTLVLLLLLTGCGGANAPASTENSPGSALSSPEESGETSESRTGAPGDSAPDDPAQSGPADSSDRLLLAPPLEGEPYSEPYDPEQYADYPNERREGFVPEATADFSAWTPDWDAPDADVRAALTTVMNALGPAAGLETERLAAALRLSPQSTEPPAQYSDTTTWRFFQLSRAANDGLAVWCEEDAAPVYAFLFGEDAVFDPSVLTRVDVGYGYSASPRPGFLYETGMRVGGVAAEVTGWSRDGDAVRVEAVFRQTDSVGQPFGDSAAVSYDFRLAADGHLVLTGF